MSENKCKEKYKTGLEKLGDGSSVKTIKITYSKEALEMFLKTIKQVEEKEKEVVC